MFDALNRFISRLDADSPTQSSKNYDGFGFQVLRNKDPDLPIEPWFDFVVRINGRQVDNPNSHLFAQEVRNCAGGSVTLGIWSAKGQYVREMRFPVPLDLPSLGLALQWTAISSTEDVWHILNVANDSPAEQAGLLPYGDYIIGTPEGIVRGEAGLSELVEDHLSRPLDLYIYNHEYDVTRLVTITPSKHWGGSGALGCVLGYGALHRLPAPLQEPPHAPGETLFEAVRFSHEDDTGRLNPMIAPIYSTSSLPEGGGGVENLLIPAEQLALGVAPMIGGRTVSPSTHRPARKARATHGASPNSAMDEYFKEGEAKSREVDYVSSTAPQAGIPPPPKALSGGHAVTSDEPVPEG